MTKRSCAFLLLTFLLVGCATGGDGGGKSGAPQVTIRLQQLDTEGGSYNFVRSRPVNIRYALFVTNPTPQPITISRVEFRTIDVGAYSIPLTSASLNIPISPGQTIRTVLSAWGTAQGGNTESRQPVTLHGTAFLLGPSGSFIQLFTQNFSQR